MRFFFAWEKDPGGINRHFFAGGRCVTSSWPRYVVFTRIKIGSVSGIGRLQEYSFAMVPYPKNVPLNAHSDNEEPERKT